MFRLGRSLPAVSIFHNSASSNSQRALLQLRDALSKPYPPSEGENKQLRPLQFNLEVVENAPTSHQIATILSYLSNSPPSALLSSTSANAASVATPASLHKLASSQPNALKWPIVVNWDDGVAAAGEDAPGPVLEALRAKRDGDKK